MANSYATNPVVIDTVFQSYKGQVNATLAGLFALLVTRVRWVGPAAGGQSATIDDPQGGAQLLQLTSAAANADVDVEFTSPRLWRDFSVASLPSGKLWIFLK